MNIMYSIKDVNDKEYKFFDYNVFKQCCDILFKTNDKLIISYNLSSSDTKVKERQLVNKSAMERFKNFDCLLQHLIGCRRNTYAENYRTAKIEKHKIKDKSLYVCNKYLDFFMEKLEDELCLLNDFENKIYKLYLLHDTQEELTGLKRIK